MSLERRCVCILCILLTLSCGAREENAPLIGNIKSRLTVDQLKRQMNIDPQNWREIENTFAPANDRRPAYHLYVIATNNFMDLGESGEVKFYFYHNRLSSVWFYPTQPKEYKSKLNINKGVSLSERGEVVLQGRLRIRCGIDFRGEEYVRFEDIPLQREHDEWISRHS